MEHGACRGVDTIAHAVAESLGFTVRPYEARWEELGRSAGPLRNQHMLDVENIPSEPVELCIAFHDFIEEARGTKDMINRASDAKIEVELIKSQCDSNRQDD